MAQHPALTRPPTTVGCRLGGAVTRAFSLSRTIRLTRPAGSVAGQLTEALVEIGRGEASRLARIVEAEITAIAAGEGDDFDAIRRRGTELVDVCEQESARPQASATQRPTPFIAPAVRAFSARQHRPHPLLLPRTPSDRRVYVRRRGFAGLSGVPYSRDARSIRLHTWISHHQFTTSSPASWEHRR
jgi:hypothetical protein